MLGLPELDGDAEGRHRKYAAPLHSRSPRGSRRLSDVIRLPVILAFDTAGSACSAAVGRGGDILARERREMRHGHAEALLPMIDRVMAGAGLVTADLHAIAVSLGPGGFTGIRAGLAAAHGLALASATRLVGVTGFAAVAALVPEGDAALLIALDSRREDFYVQLFDRSGKPLGEPAAILPDRLTAHVAATIGDTALRIAGDAASEAAAVLSGNLEATILPQTAPDARGVLAAASLEFAADMAETPVRPLYLRPPDVTMGKLRPASGGAE